MNQEQEKKYFLAEDSQLDADSAPFAVSPNSWVNMQNLRVRTTDAGVTETVESIGGTIMLSTPQPSITYITIGSAEETERSRFCYFKACTTGPWDKIVCWDEILQQEFDVLLASQVTGGLNFDKNSLIHSSRIVDGLLYWTDNLNNQRKANIDAGIKLNNPSYITDVEAYESPLDEKVITVLRPPPLYSLSISKITQPSLANNFIKLGSFQFAYNFHYRDGETSVLSNYSQLAPYNTKDGTYNRVDVSISFNQIIPQDWQQVNIAVRYGNTPNFFTIKTWDKRIAADLAAVNAHNAGTTQLVYSFYNDQTGQALDSAYSVKPFDNVPIISETLEIARERLFFGDNVIGYDTPLITSLQAAFVEQTQSGSAAGVYGNIQYIGRSFLEVHFFITISTAPGYNGYYDIGANPAYSTPVTWASISFIGTTQADVMAHWPKPSGTSVYFSPTTSHVVAITGAPFSASLVGALVYKTNAPYRLAVQFYDFGDRKSGLIDNGIVYQTNDRDYSTITYSVGLNWTLSNDNALNEIPLWATHYAVVRTKCLRTSYFLQVRAANLTYVTKDADGLYVFNTSTYATTLNGVGIDITSLNNYGMGYAFADGDIIKIYKTADATVYQLRIIAQDGKWLVAELADLGAIGNTGSPYTTSLFEIFTPYYQSFNEAFYETGDMYPILEPGTSGRLYSTIADSIRGDVTILQRDTYLTENMSPNDTYYQNWYTDAGRPCFKDYIGQKLKTNSVVWSNVYIPGSNNNGLSSFDVLDEQLLPIECGAIQKLQLTSKVSNELGLVMLAICTKETASMYIGESQLVSSIGNAFIASSSGVIGTINVMKGSRGTTHPETVVEYRGNVFFWDDGNGKLVQYSTNGLFDISSYKMTRFWKLFSDQFLSMTAEEIEALGGRPFVFMTVDPHHQELLITIPKLLNAPPKGYLPDYPFIQYPFDIWDGQAKTIVYKLGGNRRPIFLGSYSFVPEWYATLQNKLYSFVNGNNNLHNQVGNPCEFYGVQYSSKIMVIGNMMPNKPKMYNNVKVEANLKPDFVYMYNDYPSEQASSLINDDFRDLEGVWFATVKRNNLRITENGYVADGLMTGEKMRNVAMWFMFEWRVNGTPVELKFVNIGFEVSRGITV